MVAGVYVCISCLIIVWAWTLLAYSVYIQLYNDNCTVSYDLRTYDHRALCVFGSNKLFCPVSHFANICHKSVLLIKEISVLCYPSLLEHREQHSYARGIDPLETSTVEGAHEDMCILRASSTFWLRWFRSCWFIMRAVNDVNKCTGRDAGRANGLL